ncbi:MAG: ABC transporter permease subunit [Saccharofermentans sp.]|jgi:arabinogalactan oligomer/maltooligosaccharide transport system permease protein|nr:ABC transporter permease subunit [Mageeibacillus sp.]MCI1264737.1 ABC transporter permease subunit [Saccharofermentans sp.]MCI1274564.1 ABC transporter permease subunit [Saccharofermentans sp.]MCI1768947.1 ABC transporter permease subunit [Mageeibacillus sp.]MCI2043850.1 ABC transporter permease subunit [Mageeibacillus sp.]
MIEEKYKLSESERLELDHGVGIKKKLTSKEVTVSVVKQVVLAIIALIWLIPIIWLVVTAFSTNPGINIAHFFPNGYTLNNFITVLTKPDSVVQFKTWFLNTLVIAIFTCIISTIFVLQVSYSFSFCRFRGRKQLMSFSMILNMFPSVLSMIIIYFIMKQFGLTNSHIGMVIVYSAGSGLGYLVIKGFMDTISMSVKEAAVIDGASELTIFTKIVVPLCKPIIVYQIISSFLMPWGDFVFAKLMLNSGISTDWTVAIGLYNMLEKSMINKYFAIFCAGGLLVSIPISVLFLIMQKYYVEGVTSGASKG